MAVLSGPHPSGLPPILHLAESVGCGWACAPVWHDLCGSQRGIRFSREIAMKRREFLKSMTALAAGGALPAPATWSSARAQARQETLLIVSESGPNNIDIHGVGTNVPGY